MKEKDTFDGNSITSYFIKKNQKELLLEKIGIGSDLPLPSQYSPNIKLNIHFKSNFKNNFIIKFENLTNKDLSNLKIIGNYKFLDKNQVLLLSEDLIIEGFRNDQFPIGFIKPIIKFDVDLPKDSRFEFRVQIWGFEHPKDIPSIKELRELKFLERIGRLLKKAESNIVRVPSYGYRIRTTSFDSFRFNSAPTLVFKGDLGSGCQNFSVFQLNLNTNFSYYTGFNQIGNSCPMDLFIFNKDHSVSFSKNTTWAGNNELHFSLNPLKVINAKVWYIENNFANDSGDTVVKNRLNSLGLCNDDCSQVSSEMIARLDIDLANQKYNEFKFGFRINAEYININNFNPDAEDRRGYSGYSFCNNSLLISDKLSPNYSANTLNIYFGIDNSIMEEIGYTCQQACEINSYTNKNIIFITTHSTNETVAHEIGHHVGICHLDDVSNIMNSEGNNGARTNLTLGQAFKANFNSYSLLNLNDQVSYQVCINDNCVIETSNYPNIFFDEHAEEYENSENCPCNNN